MRVRIRVRARVRVRVRDSTNPARKGRCTEMTTRADQTEIFKEIMVWFGTGPHDRTSRMELRKMKEQRLR